MTDDYFDQVLRREDDIMPSSDFASSVMEAVRREAAAPPPLPFPWKWAVPGLAAATAALFGFTVLAVSEFSRNAGGSATRVAPELARLFDQATALGMGGILFALFLSYVSVRFSMRFFDGRT